MHDFYINTQAKYMVYLFLYYIFCPPLLLADTTHAPIVLGTAEVESFTNPRSISTPHGPFLDIFKNLISPLERPYEVKIYPSRKELYEAILKGDVDIGMAGSNLPIENSSLTYTLPYYTTPLSVIEIKPDQHLLYTIWQSAQTSGFISTILLYIAIIILCGFIFGFIEMHTKFTKKGKIFDSIIDSLCWSIGVMTSVGSEIPTHNRSSNIFMGICSIISLFMVTLLTGAFSSLMTLEVEQSNKVTDTDLSDRVIYGVKKNSFSEYLLTKKNISHVSYDNYDQALEDLHDKKIQAILAPSTIHHDIHIHSDILSDIIIYDIPNITISFSYLMKENLKLLHALNTLIINNNFDNITATIKENLHSYDIQQ